jgi:hypothetical protein
LLIGRNGDLDGSGVGLYYAVELSRCHINDRNLVSVVARNQDKAPVPCCTCSERTNAGWNMSCHAAGGAVDDGNRCSTKICDIEPIADDYRKVRHMSDGKFAPYGMCRNIDLGNRVLEFRYIGDPPSGLK